MNKDDNYIKVLLANFGKHTYYLLFNREVETKMVVSDYIQIISTVIYASALGISLISFSEVRRNTRIQTEQQLYMNILSSSYSLWNNETISKIAKESPEISSYLDLVDSPEEYNNISAIIDFFTIIKLPQRTRKAQEK